MECLIRRIWIVVTNAVMIYLVWPRNGAADQLNSAIGNASNSSIFTGMQSHPWLTGAVIILACGIFAEFLNSRLAAILNVSYYGVALCTAIWGATRDWHEVPRQRIYTGVMLYTIPVLVVFIVNLWFYRKSLTRRSSEATAT